MKYSLIHIVVVMLLNVGAVSGKNRGVASMDSLRKEISIAMHGDNWQTVREKSDKYIKLALDSNRKEYIADAYFCFGLGNMHTHSYDSAQNNFRRAFAMANILRNDSMSSLYLHAMGILEGQFKGHLMTSQSYYLAALQKAKQANFQLLEAALYVSLADLATARNDTSGLNWSKLALNTSKRINDKYGEANAHSLIARQSILRRDFTTALSHIKDAETLYKAYGDSGSVNFLNLIHATLFIEQGNLREAAGSLDRAEKGIDMLHGSNKLEHMIVKARILSEERKWAESTAVLKNVLQMAEGKDNHFYDGMLYDMLADNAVALGDTQEAIVYLKRRVTLQDADIKTNDVILIRESDIMYEMQEQRQQQILEHLKLKYQRKILVAVGIALACALGAIIGLVYYSRRKVQLYRSIVRQHSASIEREKILLNQIHQLQGSVLMSYDNNKDSDSSNDSSSKDDDGENRVSTDELGSDKNIDNGRASSIYSALCEMMEREHMYSSPQLSRETVAEHLGIKPLLVSQVVRQMGNCSFTDFVNNYRIREAVKILSDTTSENPLIKDIAAQSGFLSERSFFRVFKNSVGMTPSAYRNEILKMAAETHPSDSE